MLLSSFDCISAIFRRCWVLRTDSESAPQYASKFPRKSRDFKKSIASRITQTLHHSIIPRSDKYLGKRNTTGLLLLSKNYFDPIHSLRKHRRIPFSKLLMRVRTRDPGDFCTSQAANLEFARKNIEVTQPYLMKSRSLEISGPAWGTCVEKQPNKKKPRIITAVKPNIKYYL